MRLRASFAAAVLLLQSCTSRSARCWCLGFTPPALSRTHPLLSRQQRSQSFTSLSTTRLLEFQEPTTGVTVQLVGSMHYNPVSIQLTKKTLQTLAEQDRLGSVVIEMCDVRWNATTDISPIMRYLLHSEMDAAHDLALRWQRPIVFGDQRINVTVHRLKTGAIEAVGDLLVPFSGGWRRLYRNITEAWSEAVPLGENYLNTFDFLDPKLWLASPVTFVKYLLTFTAKSPLFFLVLLAILFLPTRGGAATMGAATAGTSAAVNAVGSWTKWLLSNLLESVLLTRILLKGLLVERNRVMARHILEQCRFQQGTIISPNDSVVDTGATVYAPLSVRPVAEGHEKVIVAVLGMAHCNGVMKLLTEQRVS